MKKTISILLLIAMSFMTIGCMESKADAETQAKSKEVTQSIDALQMQLGKILSNPDGIDQKAYADTMVKIADARQALVELKASGASWFTIGKGALGGVLGRTALHGVRALIIAFIPGSIGVGITSLLSLVLGGSAASAKKED
jgi:hypothetical protein